MHKRKLRVVLHGKDKESGPLGVHLELRYKGVILGGSLGKIPLTCVWSRKAPCACGDTCTGNVLEWGYESPIDGCKVWGFSTAEIAARSAVNAFARWASKYGDVVYGGPA